MADATGASNPGATQPSRQQHWDPTQELNPATPPHRTLSSANGPSAFTSDTPQSDSQQSAASRLSVATPSVQQPLTASHVNAWQCAQRGIAALGVSGAVGAWQRDVSAGPPSPLISVRCSTGQLSNQGITSPLTPHFPGSSLHAENKHACEVTKLQSALARARRAASEHPAPQTALQFSTPLRPPVPARLSGTRGRVSSGNASHRTPLSAASDVARTGLQAAFLTESSGSFARPSGPRVVG